ncbi:MAG: galactose mutarotase, partial [Bacteroidales bacterium]|nr:galactose mutarotase [Bacteroidales bacterium]
MERQQTEIKFYTLVNASGARVVLSNLGAGIVSIEVPDRDGVLDNVVLNYARPEDWIEDGPCAGKIPGRFANRIALGQFSLDGESYQLAINNGPNHLHGGPGEQCYANRIWSAMQYDKGVKFALHSPDGDAGYPGAVDIVAHYTWSDDNRLVLRMTATTDRATIVNLTNHVYFNLLGSKREGDSVKNHTLRINASHFLPTSDSLIPTGGLLPVEGTPMDFRIEKRIGADMEADYTPLHFGKGYDHCWCLDEYDGSLKEVAVLSCAESGRKVVLSSNQPGVQIYTGNWLDGCPAAPSGYRYRDYDAVAMECQAFPDSPNKPAFPF